ncbi:hypothetical protein M407DRAFT_236049 [Tulasnella calospora MUT 4182]|uniref:Transmembrane protein n=1 Tax=Tulasnella calospora MUT 4182 TaxID=1051891 RepID=A0A0C3MHI6_9AGAM|nr:hypothetical protein M407DRAFT_236049 [Tulasnella calospora MUT 4182]
MSCLPVTRTLYSTPTSVQTILTTTVTVYTRPETVTTDYRTTTVCFGDYTTDERAKRGRHQYPRQDDCSEGFDEQVVSSVITLDPQIVTEPLVVTELITSTGAPIPVETQVTALCAPETGIAASDTTPTNTLATGSRAPAIGTLSVPQYSPTESHHKTQKVGIVVGSIAAAVVVIAIIAGEAVVLELGTATLEAFELQSSVGGMGWIDPAYASQSSIDKPWLNQPYGPYAGLARQERPRRPSRLSRPSSFDARTSGATQPVSPPSREETSRQGSATSVSPTTSPGQRRARPLPAIPGTLSSFPQPAQSSATPTVLAQPSPRPPSTATQRLLNVETGPSSSNQLPPGYYQTER